MIGKWKADLYPQVLLLDIPPFLKEGESYGVQIKAAAPPHFFSLFSTII